MRRTFQPPTLGRLPGHWLPSNWLAIEQVECQRSDGVAPVGRLDPDVAGVQQANEGGDEQRLGRKHGDGDAMLEVAAPLRVVQLRKAKGVEARRGEAR